MDSNADALARVADRLFGSAEEHGVANHVNVRIFKDQPFVRMHLESYMISELDGYRPTYTDHPTSICGCKDAV